MDIQIKQEYDDEIESQARIRSKRKRLSAEEAIARKRISRKICEQNRRDRMHRYLTEIASHLPAARNSKKRVTKLAILRLSLSFLRYKHFLKNRENSLELLPEAFSKAACDLFLKELSGFMFIVDCHGKLVHISESAWSVLNTDLADVIGNSIFDYIHHADCEVVADVLNRPPDDTSDDSFSFHCQFLQSQKRGGKSSDSSDVGRYVTCRVTGRVERTKETGHESFDSRNSLFYVCVAQPISMNVPRMTVVRPENSFWSKTSLDLVLLDIDTTTTCLVTGYLGKDIVNATFGSFLHPDDIPYLLYNAQTLMSQGFTKACVYRSSTVDGKWVFVETEAHVVHNEHTKEPDHCMMLNKFIDDEEGQEKLNKQQRILLAIECNTDEDRSPLQWTPAHYSPQSVNSETNRDSGLDDTSMYSASPSIRSLSPDIFSLKDVSLTDQESIDNAQYPTGSLHTTMHQELSYTYSNQQSPNDIDRGASRNVVYGSERRDSGIGEDLLRLLEATEPFPHNVQVPDLGMITEFDDTINTG